MPRVGHHGTSLKEPAEGDSTRDSMESPSCGFTADDDTCVCVVERQRYSYGVGHMFNDLSATCWFSYLLVYLHKVAELSNDYAGYIYLLGHVVDAMCTPIVGMLSDRSRASYGRRKRWHAIGSVAAFASFPFILSDPCTTFGWGDAGGGDPASSSAGAAAETGCHSWSQWQYLLWYGAAVSVFQFGWAAVQTTHLALARELSSDLAMVRRNCIHCTLLPLHMAPRGRRYGAVTLTTGAAAAAQIAPRCTS
jgi:hypothetical protein